MSTSRRPRSSGAGSGSDGALSRSGRAGRMNNKTASQSQPQHGKGASGASRRPVGSTTARLSRSLRTRRTRPSPSAPPESAWLSKDDSTVALGVWRQQQASPHASDGPGGAMDDFGVAMGAWDARSRRGRRRQRGRDGAGNSSPPATASAASVDSDGAGGILLAPGGANGDVGVSMDFGPPPDMDKRRLIFDSLRKIVDSSYTKRSGRDSSDSRGSYIFTFGAGYHGQLGRRFGRGQKKYSMSPQLVELKEPVRMVSCGGLHTAAVTDTGRVFSWGDGRADQLGHLHEGFSNQQTPRLVDSLAGVANVAQVSCGQSHTVARTDRGVLYSWGFAKFGQLGSGERQNIKVPKRIQPTDEAGERIPPFVEVDCGDKHTAAITTDGLVYSWGCGEHGQLGHGNQHEQLRPMCVEHLRDQGVRVSFVRCGSTFTAYVSSDGKLYMSGFGEHLCPDQDQNFFYTPVLIKFREPVRAVACGQSHILALTTSGDVFSWGSGSYGQLGHGVGGNLVSPRLVLYNKEVHQVEAGRYHSVALTAYGALYTWGCGESGQLGHNSDENVFVPCLLESHLGAVVGQVACGEHHTAMLTSAPWQKLGGDVADWLEMERLEYQLKLKMLKKMHHGLFRKELQSLQEEMKEHRAQYIASRQETQQEETQYLVNEVAKIRRTDSLLLEVLREQAEQQERHLYASNDERERGDGNDTDSDSDVTAVSARTSGSSSSSKQPSQPAPPPLALPPEENGVAGGTGSWMLTGIDEDHGGTAAGPPGSPSNKGLVSIQVPSTQPPPALLRKKSSAQPHSARVAATSSSSTAAAGGAAAGTASQSGPPYSARYASTGGDGPGQEQKLSAQQILQQQLVQQQQQKLQKQQLQQQQQQALIVPSLDSDRSQHAHAAFLRESSEMVKRVTNVVARTSKSQGEYYIKRLAAEAVAFRKESDTLRHRRKGLEARLRELQKHSALLDTGDRSEVGRKRHEEQLTALEMKLDTVTIKIHETAENRKNYELSIAHLKEEEFERYQELEGLRQHCAETDDAFRRLEHQKSIAIARRDDALDEMETFRSEIVSQKDFLEGQLTRFREIARHTRKMEERRKRKNAQSDKNAAHRVQARLEKLRAEAKATEEEAARLAADLELTNDQLRYYEHRFQEISSATGLTSPEAIINKYELKEQIRRQLDSEIEAKERDIAEMKASREQANAVLTARRDSFENKKWRDVEGVEERLRAANTLADTQHQEAERAQRLLALSQEGIMSLTSQLQRALLREPELAPGFVDLNDYEEQWAPENAQTVLQELEKLLVFVKQREDEREARARRIAEEEEERRRQAEEEQRAEEVQHRRDNIGAEMLTFVRKQHELRLDDVDDEDEDDGDGDRDGDGDEEEASGAGADGDGDTPADADAAGDVEPGPKEQQQQDVPPPQKADEEDQ